MSRCNPNVHLYGASVRWLMDESVYARIPLSSLRHRKMSLSPRAYRQPANSYAFFALPVKSRQRSSLPEESSHNGKMLEWNPSARLNCSSTGFVVSRVVSFENLSDVNTASLSNFDRSKRWISRSFVREINARYDGIRQDQQFVRTDSYETYFDTLYMRDSGRKLWWQMTKCLVWKNRFKKDKLKRDIKRDNIKIKKFSA